MLVLAEVVFWLCVLALFHVFIGYPIGMAWLARGRPRPVHTAALTPTVTCVIAVHNGSDQLTTKLANLRALNYPAALLDIVIVCDGCTDDTVARARAVADAQVQVIELAHRRGKAACLNDGVRLAGGELLLLTDVRQRLEPDALRQLAANFADPAVGAAGGALCFEDPATGFARGVDAYWRYETALRLAESRSGSVIGVSGALYAMRRALFQPLPPGTVLDDVLIPMQVAQAGFRVILEPQARAWDVASTEPAQERRRKIRTLAGNFQLLQLAPWLAVPAHNPLWFRFVSHKLLRLLAPWLMLVLAACAMVLAGVSLIYTAAAVCIVAAALLVLAGWLLPPVGRLAPVRMALAFFYLNLFAAQALLAFSRQRRLHLW